MNSSHLGVNIMDVEGLRIEPTSPPQIMAGMETMELALPAAEGESTSFSNGEVRTGATRASGVKVTVQRGTSAVVHFTIEVTTISESSFRAWRNSISSFVASERLSEIEQFSNHSTAGFYFASLFGSVFHRDRSFYFQQSNRNAAFSVSNQEQEQLAQSVFNLRTEKVRAAGRLTAVGTSFIPTSVSAFVQTTQFVFKNNQRLNVFNFTSRPGLAPLALDSNGQQSAASEEQQVQILS